MTELGQPRQKNTGQDTLTLLYLVHTLYKPCISWTRFKYYLIWPSHSVNKLIISQKYCLGQCDKNISSNLQSPSIPSKITCNTRHHFRVQILYWNFNHTHQLLTSSTDGIFSKFLGRRSISLMMCASRTGNSCRPNWKDSTGFAVLPFKGKNVSFLVWLNVNYTKLGKASL